MYKFTGFSEKANTALNNAVNAAEDMGHTYIGSEHILLGLIRDSGSVAAVVLHNRRITAPRVKEQIRTAIGIGMPTKLTGDDFTPKAKRIVESALQAARSSGQTLTGTEHLLAAMLKEPQCFACLVINRLGVQCADLLNELNGTHEGERSAVQKASRNRNQPTLEKNLASLAGDARLFFADEAALKILKDRSLLSSLSFLYGESAPDGFARDLASLPVSSEVEGFSAFGEKKLYLALYAVLNESAETVVYAQNASLIASKLCQIGVVFDE